MHLPPRILAFICALAALSLHGQPTAPTPEQVARLSVLAETPLAATTTPLSVTISSREEVRQFYRSIYNASEGVPMGWTGSYTATDPIVAAGDTSAAFKEAVLLRINFFRALAGVPAAIAFNSAYSAKDQQAALMMSANSALSHTPPSSWTFYTADGATAASNSNLAIGNSGPDAITGYMADSGSNNTAAGHRRWLFYPQTLQMGTGDVSGSATLYPANVTWVIDDKFGTTRPATRTTQITYPPAGYVPYQLVWPRWSFSYPGADFSSATVTMTRNSLSVAVAPETLNTGSGENALVWVYDGLPAASAASHPKPASDTTYAVSVNNVKIGAATQNFSYNVTVFDPDVAGGDYAPATVSMPATISAGQAAAYTVTAPAFASQYEFRPLQFAAYSKTYNAESGLAGIVAQISSYSAVVTDTVGAGTASYHLALPDTSVLNQTLTLPETFYAANSGASLTFLSRLGYATSQQIAHAQIALDDGTAWFDVYSLAGTSSNSNNVSTEASFATHTVSLAAYAGRTFRVRFTYSYSGTGSYYPDTSAGVGWYLDNIALTGVQSATAGTSTIATNGTGGTLTAASAGTIGVQARGLFFGTYPMEWGPVTSVTVSTATATAPSFTTQPTGQTVTAGANVTLTAAASGSPAPTYQWKKSGTDIAGATGATLAIASATAYDAGTYTVVATNSAGNVTSNAATLAVNALDTSGSYLANLSVRVAMASGQTLIVGFVVNGGAKPILVRAAGPVLNKYGLTGVVDPQLNLFNGSNTLVAANDNWDAALATTFATLGAFPFDTGSKDAALQQTINGPNSAQATATGPGALLVEAYDAGPNDGRKLVNLSTRFQVGTGDNILITGFVLSGTGFKQVLIRAVGPKLTDYGVTGVLADPQVGVFNSSGTQIASNDNWSSTLSATFTALGAFALNPGSKDAALVVTLQAGKLYTVQISGVGNTTGEALAEVYALP
jgi:hypothetical protein